MAKIQKITKAISPFAGIFLVNHEFSCSGVDKLIDKQLGIRFSTCGYTYSNILRNFFNLFLSGGECAEDIQNNDFGWKHLPTSNMNANTVYLIITAMIKNFTMRKYPQYAAFDNARQGLLCLFVKKCASQKYFTTFLPKK